MQEWGVAMATATKVLATMRQEGLVQTLPGVGTVVAAPTERPTSSGERRIPRNADANLSSEQIVRAAMAIADSGGLKALTMRRVAVELNVTTVSLMRQVGGEDELIVRMADAAFGEHPFPRVPPKGWRARLELGARTQWQIYRRHPWLAQAMSFTRPILTPHTLAHSEWGLAALDGLGLSPEAMFQVHISIANYVRATAINLVPEAEAEQDTGVTDTQWVESQRDTLGRIFASGAFPVFSRLQAMQSETDLGLETLLEFGLQRMLDGVAAMLGRNAD